MISTICFLPITYYNYKGRNERIVETGTRKKEGRYHTVSTTREGGGQMKYESEGTDRWVINLEANWERDTETQVADVGNAGVGVASMCVMEGWQIGAGVGREEREPCTRKDKKVDKMDITWEDGL